MKRVVCLSLILAGGNLCFGSLVQTSQIDISGAGFGSIPRLVSMQANGTESGCVAVSTLGAIVIGPTACDGNPGIAGNNDAVILGNGLTNGGGSEPPPLVDDNKYSIPLLSSYGITSLANLQIVYDATNNPATGTAITDVTLKFYNGTSNAFITSIDGQVSFVDTTPGNGGAGVVLTIDATQLPLVQAALTAAGVTNVGNARIALEATITNSAAGPESFFLRNAGGGGGVGGPIPEPSTYMMLLPGILVLAKFRRKFGVR